jgi:hypothetical protein
LTEPGWAKALFGERLTYSDTPDLQMSATESAALHNLRLNRMATLDNRTRV